MIVMLKLPQFDTFLKAYKNNKKYIFSITLFKSLSIVLTKIRFTSEAEKM